MGRGGSLVTPQTQVGLVGGVLLVVTYAGLAALTDFESVVGLGLREIATFAAPAFVVGGVVAVFAAQYVPVERRTRSGHVRTVLTMMVGPGVLLGAGIAILGALIWFSSDLLNTADRLVQQATGPGGFVTVIAAIVLIIAAIVLLAILIALLVLLIVLGAALQVAAALGYALTTVALGRLADEPATAPSTPDPPD